MLVVMKRGGQPDNIAINPERVTYVRSASGPFTDIHFGEHHVSVEGTFEQVVAKLSGEADGVPQREAPRTWLRTT
jgi:hypothetical protein